MARRIQKNEEATGAQVIVVRAENWDHIGLRGEVVTANGSWLTVDLRTGETVRFHRTDLRRLTKWDLEEEAWLAECAV